MVLRANGKLSLVGAEGIANSIASQTLAVQVLLPPLAPPVAKVGGPYTVAEGSNITLSGSGSEVGGSITKLEWDFNYDGKTFTADATGPSPTFSAAALDGPSTSTIALRVTDNYAVTTIATATVSITNVPPTAEFGTTTAYIPIGSSGTVSFALQEDPSAADVAAGFKYSYDFNNDGIFEISNSSLASVTVPASYLVGIGFHTIRGRITDKDGGLTDYIAVITIASPKYATISGTVFTDNNGNAKFDSTEKGVSGRKVYIDKNKNGVLDAGEATIITGTSGSFTFSGLAAGTYRVRDVLPSGWRRTSPTSGYFDVTVTAGQSVTGKNFAETTYGLISGTVFKDANGNGVKDSTEVGLSGWVVYLDTNNNGKLDAGERSFITGSDGKFSFVVPAGKYNLREVLKTGFKRTTAAGVYAITLSSGQTVSGKNFGNR